MHTLGGGEEGMKDQDYFTFTSTYGTLCIHWGGGGGEEGMKDQDYFTFTSTYGTLCIHCRWCAVSCYIVWITYIC